MAHWCADYRVGGFSRRDIITLIAAGIGLLLWYVTSNAALALFISIAIDAAAASLTVRKAYLDPSSETLSTWLLSGTSGIFAAFAVGSFNVVLLAFPVYVILINYLVAGAILLGRRTSV
jgi:hypothetical protein